MKKIYTKFLIGFLFVLGTVGANAQVTVTNPLNTTPGLAATYLDLAAAVTALNLQTAISGPVIITLDPGNPQTAPAGGYTINAALTGASGVNTVTFEGSANTITASAALTAGVLHDAIFEIIGSDFMTIQNFIMQENAANTTTLAASNNMTEWGVALLYASTTNGAQNITIQNNTITLNRTYQNTFGIYSNSTHSATVVATSATATTTAGGNSGLKVYSNTINNVNQGIVVVGPTAAADYNTGVEVGGTAPTANTITNYGTTATFSGYANVSGTVNGILVRNSIGFTVSYNTVTSSVGGVTSGTLNGIQVPAASATPTATFTNNINNNSISLQSGLIAGAMNGITYPSGSASTTSTLNVNSNNFHTFGHTVAGTGAIIFITIASTNQHTSISSNTFTNITVNTTGSVTFISHGYTIPAAGSQTISLNSIVTAFNKTSAGGTVACITSGTSSVLSDIIVTHTNNNFSNITVTGATTLNGIASTDGLAAIALNRTVTGNVFNNWTGGTSTITVMSYTYWGGNTSTVSTNTITNITGQGAITGMSFGASGNNANPLTVSSNTINNLTSTGTGGTVTGIACSNTSPAINISNHEIHTLSSTGASAVNGITISGASVTGTNVFKNKIYNLSGSNASSTVNGLNISGGSLVTAYNNIIGDLRTSAANAANPLVGINVSGGTTVNLRFNTVWLSGTSVGALFGSSAISASTTPTLELRNNIFVNNSTPAGATGFSSAYRRNTITLTSYAAASNNNLFYAGTPGINNLIMYDGTNSYQTLAAYKTAVSPRDGGSVTENPPFLSLVGGNANFLHIDPLVATQIESAAATIGGITDDFDGDIRNVTTPDIGADEFAGIAADLTGPTISYTNLGNTSCLTDRTLSPVIITDGSGVNIAPGTRPRLYYKKIGDANTFNDNTNLTDGWKYIEATGAGGSPFSFTTDYSLLFTGAPVTGDIIQYFVVAEDLAGIPNVGINAGSFTATPASVALTAAAFPIGGTLNSYTLTPVGLSGIINVGAAETFKSLTEASAATGVFAAINANGLSGNTTIVLMDASITETGTTALNTITSSVCSGGPFTLLIKPNTTTTLTGSVTSGALIKLNGADNVTIDGSNNGSTSRDLTIINTGTTAPTVIALMSLGTGLGATNNTIKNSFITTGVNTTVGYGVAIGGATPGTSGADNDNNTIQNNVFTVATAPIYALGTANTSTGGMDNLNVTDNSVSFTTTLNSVIGMRFGNALNATISNNTISIETSNAIIAGVSLEAGFINSLVSRNVISKVRSTAPATIPVVRGIVIGTGQTGSNVTIVNNVIYNIIAAYATTIIGSNCAGIVLGATGVGTTYTVITGGINIYYNSINLFGTVSRDASTTEYSLFVGSVCSGLDIRNNILANSILNVHASGTGSKSYAIYSQSANTAYSNINHNDYYASGTQAVLGFLGVDRTTLVDWQTATAQDANSIAVDPLFNSNTNLQPQPLSLVVNAGTPIAGITTDITGFTRSATTPTIGAYEQAADLTAPVITFNPLNGTLCLTDRTLSPVTITDAATGVNIAPGTRPRLYFKKLVGNANTFNDNTNLTDGWKYVEATGAGNTPFSFTTDYSLLFGGLPVAGDIIQYFVVAEDNAAIPNVAINSGVFNATPTSVALTAAAFPITGTINQYLLIAGGLAADVTIGAAETYPTLTGVGGLFEAINNGGLLANITARIVDAAIVEDGTNSLNAINYGCAGSYTLLIKPDVSVTTVLSGTNATALINLNGADNVTFDGSNNGTSSKDMTIRNISTGGATIRFINDAVSNIIKNSILEGASTSTTAAVIVFSTSTGTLGNSNNTIMDNDIRDRVDLLSAFANSIYSSGSAGAPNASNTISGNNLFNFTANGINLTSTGIGDSWQITNNNFYNNLVTLPATAQTSILVSGGSSHIISGNFIGGQAILAGSTPWVNSGAITFTGINLAGVGAGGAVSVQNNTIQNINLTTVSAGSGSFNGILISGASTVNAGTITGNTIGHASTANSIQNSGGSTFIGINSSSTGAVNFSNNTIANLTGTGTTTSIGMRGISHTGAGALTISNNNIHTLTGASATTSATTASLLGIYSASASSGQVISGNTIYNLVQTNATAATQVIGINLNNNTGGNGTISRNWIYGFINPSTSATAYIKGMQAYEGTWTFVNNMISITNGTNTNGPIIAGIYDWPTGESTVANFNSIYIGGDGSAGTNKSHAYYRQDGLTNTLRNNILYNARTGGTGAHYAVSNVATVPATGWSSDYNDLFAADVNTVGEWGTGVPQTFAQWQTSSAGDANSKSILPNFVSTIDLHLVPGTNCGLDGYGIPYGGVTTDFDVQTRDITTPDMGADEFTAVYSGTLAGIVGSPVCENKTVSAAGTTYATSVCDLIARVMPSGGAAANGKIDVCVTLDGTQQYFNGEPYVQRHHDIAPVTNPTTSTATISLYFTDAEFVAYNTNNPVRPPMPTVAGGGSTDPNRANVLVTEFFGTPTTTPSQPGFYTLGTRVVIDPLDANITWNGSYWTVTFDVTGFGGFYVHSNIFGAPLPISINYFTGVKQGSDHLLNWKVTCNSTPRATMILERSADSRNFTPIHTVTADAARCNQPFDYTDAQPLPGMNYYRLKMIDDNGTVTYSGIVALLNAVKGFEIISIAPNPVTTGNFKLNVTSATAVTIQVIITDMQGRMLSRQSIPVVAGFSSIPMNAGNLAAGTYTIQAILEGEKSKIIRFVKQ